MVTNSTRWGKHTNRTSGREDEGEVQTRGKEGSYCPAHSLASWTTGGPKGRLDCDRPTNQLSPISLHLSEYELTTVAGTATADRPADRDRDMGICKGGRDEGVKIC